MIFVLGQVDFLTLKLFPAHIPAKFLKSMFPFSAHCSFFRITVLMSREAISRILPSILKISSSR